MFSKKSNFCWNFVDTENRKATKSHFERTLEKTLTSSKLIKFICYFSVPFTVFTKNTKRKKEKNHFFLSTEKEQKNFGFYHFFYSRKNKINFFADFTDFCYWRKKSHFCSTSACCYDVSFCSPLKGPFLAALATFR